MDSAMGLMTDEYQVKGKTGFSLNMDKIPSRQFTADNTAAQSRQEEA